MIDPNGQDRKKRDAVPPASRQRKQKNPSLFTKIVLCIFALWAASLFFLLALSFRIGSQIDTLAEVSRQQRELTIRAKFTQAKTENLRKRITALEEDFEAGIAYIKGSKDLWLYRQVEALAKEQKSQETEETENENISEAIK